MIDLILYVFLIKKINLAEKKQLKLYKNPSTILITLFLNIRKLIKSHKGYKNKIKKKLR